MKPGTIAWICEPVSIEWFERRRTRTVRAVEAVFLLPQVAMVHMGAIMARSLPPERHFPLAGVPVLVIRPVPLPRGPGLELERWPEHFDTCARVLGAMAEKIVGLGDDMVPGRHLAVVPE